MGGPLDGDQAIVHVCQAAMLSGPPIQSKGEFEMSNTVYHMITDRINELLSAGVIPWRKPWVNRGNVAVNWVTQKPYRGINTFLLDGGEYATMKQINDVGGRVKKGEKSHIVVFWTWLHVKDKDTGAETEEKIPFLRYYRVFEINTQCVGMESRRPPAPEFEHNPIEEAEKIVRSYSQVPIQIGGNKAAYQPAFDRILAPSLTDYPVKEEYYSTLFHELIHSTGHATRLSRPGIVQFDKFGSERYSKEELIAEMGAAMLCGMAGIAEVTLPNSAAYIAGWLRALKGDPKLVVQAAGAAQKAADYVLGIEYSQRAQEEVEPVA